MLVYANSLTQKIRTAFRSKTSTHKTAIAGTFSRWFFAFDRGFGTKFELIGGLQSLGSREEARSDWREKSLVYERNVIVEKCDFDAPEGVRLVMKNRCREGAEYLRKAC